MMAYAATAQTIKATSDAYKGYIKEINENGGKSLFINDHSFLLVTTSLLNQKLL